MSFTQFIKDESGANAIEYALIGGLLSVAVGYALVQTSDALASSIQGICNTVADIVGAGGC